MRCVFAALPWPALVRARPHRETNPPHSGEPGQEFWPRPILGIVPRLTATKPTYFHSPRTMLRRETKPPHSGESGQEIRPIPGLRIMPALTATKQTQFLRPRKAPPRNEATAFWRTEARNPAQTDSPAHEPAHAHRDETNPIPPPAQSSAAKRSHRILESQGKNLRLLRSGGFARSSRLCNPWWSN